MNKRGDFRLAALLKAFEDSRGTAALSAYCKAISVGLKRHQLRLALPFFLESWPQKIRKPNALFLSVL